MLGLPTYVGVPCGVPWCLLAHCLLCTFSKMQSICVHPNLPVYGSSSGSLHDLRVAQLRYGHCTCEQLVRLLDLSGYPHGFAFDACKPFCAEVMIIHGSSSLVVSPLSIDRRWMYDSHHTIHELEEHATSLWSELLALLMAVSGSVTEQCGAALFSRHWSACFLPSSHIAHPSHWCMCRQSDLAERQLFDRFMWSRSLAVEPSSSSSEPCVDDVSAVAVPALTLPLAASALLPCVDEQPSIVSSDDSVALASSCAFGDCGRGSDLLAAAPVAAPSMVLPAPAAVAADADAGIRSLDDVVSSPSFFTAVEASVQRAIDQVEASLLPAAKRACVEVESSAMAVASDALRHVASGVVPSIEASAEQGLSSLFASLL